jgi:hypothetical protein
LGAKQTIFEERYQAYMRLLRKIVMQKRGKGTDSVQGTIDELENQKAYYKKLNDEQQKKVDELAATKEKSLNWIAKMLKGKKKEELENDEEYKKNKEAYDKAEEELEKYRNRA